MADVLTIFPRVSIAGRLVVEVMRPGSQRALLKRPAGLDRETGNRLVPVEGMGLHAQKVHHDDPAEGDVVRLAGRGRRIDGRRRMSSRTIHSRSFLIIDEHIPLPSHLPLLFAANLHFLSSTREQHIALSTVTTSFLYPFLFPFFFISEFILSSIHTTFYLPHSKL